MAAGACPDRGAVGVHLGEFRVVIAEQPEHWDEEEALTEDAPERKAQRIAHQPARRVMA